MSVVLVNGSACTRLWANQHRYNRDEGNDRGHMCMSCHDKSFLL